MLHHYLVIASLITYMVLGCILPINIKTNKNKVCYEFQELILIFNIGSPKIGTKGKARGLAKPDERTCCKNSQIHPQHRLENKVCLLDICLTIKISNQ